MKDLSIIIPCYNESRSIPRILSRLKELIPSEKDIELIIVNNGSTDDTKQVLNKELPKSPFLKVITIERNVGYGNGIIAGLRASSGKYLCWTHGDNQIDLSYVFNAFSLAGKNRFVKGSRKNQLISKKIFTFAMSLTCSLLTGRLLYDINAQPNLFPRSFLKYIDNSPKDFTIEIYAYYMAKTHKLEIIRFPVKVKERRYGVSSWDLGLKSKFNYFNQILKFKNEYLSKR